MKAAIRGRRHLVRLTHVILFCAIGIASAAGTATAECKRHIELHSAKHDANELGKSVEWTRKNYRIDVWANTQENWKFPMIGTLIPGAQAEILGESSDDYQIKIPKTQIVGWVGKIQVAKTVMVNPATGKLCK